MSKDDSQPAFPQHIGYATNPEGMTLRDWFAGQALAGFCSMSNRDGEWTWDAGSASTRAYEMADAMLAERAKP